jgi:hypothetical protein
MDSALGRDGDPGESAEQALSNLAGTPDGVLALHVQDVVLPPGREADSRSHRDAGSCRSALEPRIPVAM